jgi:hypothetical protein
VLQIATGRACVSSPEAPRHHDPSARLPVSDWLAAAYTVSSACQIEAIALSREGHVGPINSGGDSKQPPSPQSLSRKPPTVRWSERGRSVRTFAVARGIRVVRRLVAALFVAALASNLPVVAATAAADRSPVGLSASSFVRSCGTDVYGDLRPVRRWQRQSIVVGPREATRARTDSKEVARCRPPRATRRASSSRGCRPRASSRVDLRGLLTRAVGGPLVCPHRARAFERSHRAWMTVLGDPRSSAPTPVNRRCRFAGGFTRSAGPEVATSGV